MKNYTIKSISVSKDYLYEIHLAGCKDLMKNQPIDLFDIIANNPLEVIRKDGGKGEIQNYKMMPCCK
jgi:hypothetical protein